MTTLRQGPPRIVIGCAKCGRHGKYDRAKAIQLFGNINLDDSCVPHSISRVCPDEAPAPECVQGAPSDRQAACRLILI
jgi:hypothetical protein